MRRIYFDNAATSFPKPQCVHDAMLHYATKLGASAGRGAYREARETGEMIQQCRRRIAALINAPDEDHIIMTSNCSDGLNLALHGLLGPGDHAITTAMDHNSILRPLNELKGRYGLEFDIVPCSAEGIVDVDDVRKAIKPHTKLIAILHASNVTGSVQPIEDVAKIAADREIVFLVDAAQSAGHWPIDVQNGRIDLLAAAGHKGPLGPLGTGFLYIRAGVQHRLRTLKQGGTGTRSEQAVQPDNLPDKYEGGSHNAVGIAALNAGVGWVLERSVESIRQHERKLCQRFIAGLDGIGKGLTWYGPRQLDRRVGVFSVCIDGYGPQALSGTLEERFGILSRAGLHCAPFAHRTLGTFERGGTTRISMGAFITDDDVDRAISALAALAGTE